MRAGRWGSAQRGPVSTRRGCGLVAIAVALAAGPLAPAGAATVSPLLSPQVLSPAGQLSPQMATLAVAPNGAAAAAWFNQDAAAFVARRPSATGAWTVERAPGGFGWDRPTVAVDGAGRTLLIERVDNRPPFPVSLRVRGPIGWSPRIPVSATSGPSLAPPALATTADGRVVIVWVNHDFNTIGVRVWNPTTQALTPLQELTITLPDFRGAFPSVATSPAGRTLVMGRYELQPDSSLLDLGLPDGSAAIGDDGSTAVVAVTGAAHHVSLTVDPAGATLPVTRSFAPAMPFGPVLNQTRNTGQVVVADGAAITTWFESDGNNHLIRVGEVDVATGVARPARTIDGPGNHTGRHSLERPFLTATADGTVTLLWDDETPLETFTTMNTWFSSRDPATGVWSAPQMMLPDDDVQDMTPQTGIDAAGRTTVVWTAQGIGSPPVIVSARFDPYEPLLTPIVAPRLAMAGAPVAMRTRDRRSAAWRFGDGATAKGKSVAHVFKRGGTFTVRATTAHGAARSARLQVISALTFGITSERSKVKNGRFSVPLSCQGNSRGCKGTLTVTVTPKRKLRARFSILPGRAATVNLRLGLADQKRLKAKRKLVVLATAKAGFGSAIRRIRLER